VCGVKRLNGKFATDTAYGKLQSLRSNIGCQIYSHKFGFKVAYPIQKVDGNHVGDTLTQFISDYGVPEHLTLMAHLCRQDRRQDSWTQFGGMKSSTTCPALDSQTRIPPNRVYMKTRNDGIESC
jgi:hypothetical protein